MQSLIQNNLLQIRNIMKEHGVVSAFAFGSVLTDNMRLDSDIDFVVKFDEAMDYQEYGNNYFKLIYALQDLFKRDVDLVAEETLQNPYFIQHINQNKLQVL